MTVERAVGRTRVRRGRLASADLARLAAVLGRPSLPDRLPLGWQWASLNDVPRAADMGEDGHPQRGDFLPELGLPRRMFAGASMRLISDLLIDAPTEVEERIISVQEKIGRTGRLAFVELERLFFQYGQLRLSETQTLVYRQAAQGPAVQEVAPAPGDVKADWREAIHPDPVMLFRFSAATFNAHRIHYDRDYAQRVEFYPGLVVHGPLVALLLLEALFRYTGRSPKTFHFRALSPLFDTAPFFVCGRLDGDQAELWAEGADGQRAMTAGAWV